jgi:DNA-binding MurR/RpiR family transcriptional regulator
MTALETRFAEAESHLGSSRRQLIREILEHSEDTYFLSSRALAQRYGLEPTTIVRTIQALGYKRYGEFAADLRSHFVARITPYATWILIGSMQNLVQSTILGHRLMQAVFLSPRE